MRLNEEQIIRSLKSTGDKYAPLAIKSIEEKVPLRMGFGGGQADAIIGFSIQNGLTFEALVEITTVATPKNILDKIGRLKDYANKDGRPDVIPMIVAPYIGSRQAKILVDKGISWIDLCGNMSIRVSNQIYIERNGKPNLYPDTSPIKKIFQGTSSLVSRALLLNPKGFKFVNEIFNFILDRNQKVALSTISKVLKVLEEELLVTRNESCIYVTYPERLLDRLAEGYENSSERRKRNTYRFAIGDIQRLSPGVCGDCKDYLACGFYAAQIKGLAVTDKITIFVKDLEQFQRKAEERLVSITADVEFGNLIITETNDPGVWFNPSWRTIDSVVDDIELYLEMAVDTPRGPKIAEQLKRRILQKAESSGQ